METSNKVEESLALTEDEKKVLLQYKLTSDTEAFSLGNLRKQFLNAEAKILEKCEKADADLMEYIRNVAKAKGLPENEQWSLNLENFSFTKVS